MNFLHNMPEINNELFAINNLYYKEKFKLIKSTKKLVINLVIFFFTYNDKDCID